MDFLESDTWKNYFENKNTKILMLGIFGAGKTTILNQFHLSDHIKREQIIGFNPENLEFKGFNIISWDYEGGDKIREFWRKQYFPKTKGVIYVIDSSDSLIIDQAIEELHNILKEEELKNSVFLIYLNKSDLSNAMSENDFEKKLNLKLLENRTFKIQKSVAITGNGIYEGLNWLGENICNKS